MLDVLRTDGLIQVRTDRLSFALHLDSLAMELTDSEGRTTLSGFLPRVVTPGAVLLAEQPLADGFGEIRSRLGVATRVQVRARLEGELELSLAIDFGEQWNGAIFEMALENRADHARTILSLDPCWWNARAGGKLTLPHERGTTWFFCMGFASHSRAGFVPLGARGPERIHADGDPWQGPLSPAWERNRFVSDCATQLCAPDRGGLTVGFVTHERFFNHVAVRADGFNVSELLASVPVEARLLQPRSTLRAERLWLGLDPPGSDGIATWAEHTALEMGVSVRPGATAAWSSRHAQLGERGVFGLREAVNVLQELDAGVRVVDIEQGYESRLGDWLAPSDGFAGGIAPACREIEEAGFEVGIWLAPFLAAADSQLARSQPDWLLRGPDGRLSTPFQVPGLKSPCVALDPGNPEVREWLANLTRTLHAAGCKRLRLDWLAMGVRGTPRSSGETTVEAYRGALRAIREATPEAPWMVASRAPLGPSIGLVDAMRSGPDLGLPWRARRSWLQRGDLPSGGGAEHAVGNALVRARLGSLWRTDPDCLPLREEGNPLSTGELTTVASVALLCGGLVSFSGSFRDLGPTRVDLLRRVLPSLGRTPEIGAPVRGNDSYLLTRFPDGSVLVLLPNLDTRARSFELDLVKLGLKGPQHVWDALGQSALGITQNRWLSQKIPAHGALLLRFSPADGRPRVIGSSLHLSAGAIEVNRLRSEPDGSIALRLAQPGRRNGSFLLVAGGDTSVAMEVSFAEQIDLQLSALGLENLPKMTES